MPRTYLHNHPEWPRFTWRVEDVSVLLERVHFRRGALLTAMEALGFDLKRDTMIRVLVEDVTKSSEIEGEILDAQRVRSSITRRLGLDFAGLPRPSRREDGVVEMMLDATQRYSEPLTERRILAWHYALFPEPWTSITPVRVGSWRQIEDGPMQVVSGPFGKPIVHFEAPGAERLQHEMRQFFSWFESSVEDPVLKAALAHLWFVTIHPLDDGNGRVSRAIADLALARADRSEKRFYSMSAEINRRRDAYYEILERTQSGSMDVTAWMRWFLETLEAAIEAAEVVHQIVRSKTAFWDRHRDAKLNERQIKVVNLLFENFVGKLRTDKYAKLAKCSKPTAFRDLNELVQLGLLTTHGAGRGVWYEINSPELTPPIMVP